MKKQQKVLKGRPRGRPFPPGKSGNLRGRPPGARNKFTLMVEAGIRESITELSKPPTLNKTLPYEAWGDRYVQFGRVFRKDNLLEKNPGAPALIQPEMLDIRKPRQELFWRGHDLLLQEGWPFCRRTHKPLKINAK
jgi:hypothetical protein